VNLLVTPAIWQNSAQNDLGSSLGCSARVVSNNIHCMADVPSKTSACTTQYRYPSPSKRFGAFWPGPLFFGRKAPTFEQRMAEKPQVNSGDSHENPNLLYLPAIKTIVGGTKQCRSNTWPWSPFLSRRLLAVWTTTFSAQVQALLQALLSWKSLAAACSLVRLSARARVRCATILAYATNLTQKFQREIRTGFRARPTKSKTTTVGHALRWFFAFNHKLGAKPEFDPCRDGAEYTRKAC